MNLGIVRLDQLISKLFILSKHCLQSLLLRFATATYAEHNLIEVKLYNNWSAQTVNKISESAMSNFLMWKKKCQLGKQKKTEDGENIFFKALAHRFWLILKLTKRVKEQQCCL